MIKRVGQAILELPSLILTPMIIIACIMALVSLAALPYASRCVYYGGFCDEIQTEDIVEDCSKTSEDFSFRYGENREHKGTFQKNSYYLKVGAYIVRVPLQEMAEPGDTYQFYLYTDRKGNVVTHYNRYDCMKGVLYLLSALLSCGFLACVICVDSKERERKKQKEAEETGKSGNRNMMARVTIGVIGVLTFLLIACAYLDIAHTVFDNFIF